MTTDTLAKAKEFELEIIKLQKHREHISKNSDEIFDYSASIASIHVKPKTSFDARELQNRFLPISLSEYVDLYLARVDKEINKLKKELEKL